MEARPRAYVLYDRGVTYDLKSWWIKKGHDI
jgi:hypothetical protein